MARARPIRWPTSGIVGGQAPDWYVDQVFRNALRRVVAVLNRGSLRECARIDLAAPDRDIAEAFERSGLDEQLIQFNIEGYDVYSQSAEHHAEFHFYANARFVSRGGRRVAVFKVPRVFLDWGYQSLRRPPADPLVGADFPGGQNDPAYVMHCATNYLVKNFWHNYVHGEIQGIDQNNYTAFRGIAREDSDFEADNVANLLTLRSYGVPVRYQARPNEAYAARVDAIFTRNRCNQLFARRASHRQSDAAAASEEERWSDLEWRFCRGVANRLSTTLIAAHLAAPSVKVFLGGDVRSSPARGTRWRHGNVLVEVAGRRLSTPYAAYVPDDEFRALRDGGAVAPDRQAVMRRRRVERETEIAGWVRGEYGRAIKGSETLRKGVGRLLEALETRISVALA
jgi:hypothetical protein